MEGRQGAYSIQTAEPPYCKPLKNDRKIKTVNGKFLVSGHKYYQWFLAQTFYQLQTINSGHLYIAKYQVDRLFLQNKHSLGGSAAAANNLYVSGFVDIIFKQFERQGLVVNYYTAHKVIVKH